jgi:hypothetical protein
LNKPTEVLLAQRRLDKFQREMAISSPPWCCTSFLKFFVLAIIRLRSAPPALALLVVLSICLRRVDVALLPLLRAADHQDR